MCRAYEYRPRAILWIENKFHKGLLKDFVTQSQMQVECFIESSLESPMGKNPYFAGAVIVAKNQMTLQI